MSASNIPLPFDVQSSHPLFIDSAPAEMIARLILPGILGEKCKPKATKGNCRK